MSDFDTSTAVAESPITPEVPETSAPAADPWSADSERDARPIVDEAPGDAEPQPAVAQPTELGADDIDRPKPRKPRDNPEARLKDATAKEARAKEDARLAREESAQLRARLAALEQPKPQATAAPANEPDFEQDFESKVGTDGGYPTYGSAVQAFNRAYAKWNGEQHQQAIQQTLAQRDQQQREQSRLNSHHERVAAAKASEPDFEESIPAWNAAFVEAGMELDPSGEAKLPPVIVEAIVDSPKGPQIMRWLGTHPQDAVQLAREHGNAPASAVPLMRRYLESQTQSAVARPDSASVVRPSAAKPPINRVGGTASATPVDVDDLPFGPDYMRAAEAEEKKRAGGRW